MPLREDLLAPIAGENPAGANLRYDKTYDQIKEARTEEDDTVPSGAWARQTKKADYRTAAKLAGELLAGRSKDLQLAAWLGEALISMEGPAALEPSLRLLLNLQESFWETLYPEIDEGDAGMRVVPLQWAANRYAALLYAAGLTRSGIDFLEYKAARALGTEEDASGNDQKRKLREEAIADGKPTSEEVDAAIAATPKVFYVSLEASLSATGQTLQSLESFCDERYGDDGPSFRKLRQAVEEVHNLVASLLREKRELEPDPVVAAAPPAMEPELESFQEEVVSAPHTLAEPKSPVEEQRAAPQSEGQRSTRQPAQAAQPQSWEDAVGRIEAAVAYLADQQPDSPVPFLVRSALRIGELREIGASGQFDLLVAPPTELRQTLKRAASEGAWFDVYRFCIGALGQPCGRGWLDLYRYLWTTCQQMGWEAQQRAVVATLQQCLRDLPQAPSWTLDDDTPAANPETVQWIAAEIAPPPAVNESAQEAPPIVTTVVQMPPIPTIVLEQPAARGDAEEELFVSAQALARHGDVQGAIQMLARDASQQAVGRLRFRRNLQIAELCVESGHTAVALPVLQGLTREVEERKLESWEPRESASRPYALLLQCAPAARVDTASIFARLCAIDPSAALTMAPVAEG